jgi:hypothetical protein
MIMTRHKKKGRRRIKNRGRQRARRTLARNGTSTVLHPTPMMKDWLPPPLTKPPSPHNKHRTCLMAKKKKVHTRDTPKYTSSSDDEVDYSDLFKGLDRSKVDKINELINALNENDRLLEKQEDILYEEHDKLVNAEKSLALEFKRNEIISSKLSSCNESVSSLKSFTAKLEKVNVTSSSFEHVSNCNRCKDFDIDACNTHASTHAQLKTCKNDYEKLKFAREAYTIGRHPSIKDGLGFQKGTKNLTS